MNRKGKRFFSLLLAAVLLVSASAVVWAEGDSRVVLGADLTEDQIATVYRLFGIERGSVAELSVTNAEERSYLKDYVDEKVIGKYGRDFTPDDFLDYRTEKYSALYELQ